MAYRRKVFYAPKTDLGDVEYLLEKTGMEFSELMRKLLKVLNDLGQDKLLEKVKK